jgi:putative peptide maturation dehydrogenase
MQLRRCAIAWLEPRDVAHFDLDDLLAGGTGVHSAVRWFAHAPHLAAPVEVEADAVALLGSVGPGRWIEADALRERHGAQTVQRLFDAGLLVGDAPDARADDDRFRQQHWHGLAALWHAASRWEGLDAAAEIAEAGLDTSDGLRDAHGAPPPALLDRGDVADRIPLVREAPEEFDALLDARTTCRNFDTARPLPQAQFARVLERAFGARATLRAADDFDVVKKTSPSGGALHPTEAYLIVQRVEGVPPGLYHYRAGDHALQPLPAVDDLAAFARVAVSGQQWFADAHVLVVLAPRFARNFWKYRQHPKAYRVAILDVGHLSQTLQLAATDLGLGACITAAINEVDIERAFGLTHFVDGPLAVCGFGLRADAMTTSEFDPNRAVWKRTPG